VRCANRSWTAPRVLKRLTPYVTHHFPSGSLHAPTSWKLALCLGFVACPLSNYSCGRYMVNSLSAGTFWSWFLRTACRFAELFWANIGCHGFQHMRHCARRQGAKFATPDLRRDGDHHAVVGG